MDNLNIKQQRTAAAAFAEKWAGRGYEKGDTAPFWLEFLRECLGVLDPDKVAKFEKRVDAGFPDVPIADTGVIIEQKSLEIDLNKPEERQKRMVTPYEQALSYVQSLPPSLSHNYRDGLLAAQLLNRLRILRLWSNMMVIIKPTFHLREVW